MVLSNLAWLVEDRSIEPRIPVFDKPARDNGSLERADFLYGHEDDSDICPGGKRARRSNRNFSTPRSGVDKDGLSIIRALPLSLAETRTTLAETAERARKVTGSSSSLFAAEVVECVAEGRAPTTQELYAVAERIGRDSGMGPIFAWGDSAPASAEERYLLRAAHAALRGTDILSAGGA